MKKIKFEILIRVAAPILLLFYFANFLFAAVHYNGAGTFGDTFGAVNALFSGSALFFLVLALLTQREELSIVKEEREDTKKILADQVELNKHQQSVLRSQSYEQSLQSIVSLISRERERLDRPSDNNPEISVAQLAEDDAKFSLSTLSTHLQNAGILTTDQLRECRFFRREPHFDEYEIVIHQITALIRLIDDFQSKNSYYAGFERSLVESLVNRRLALVWAYLAISRTESLSGFSQSTVSAFRNLQVDLTLEHPFGASSRFALDPDFRLDFASSQ